MKQLKKILPYIPLFIFFLYFLYLNRGVTLYGDDLIFCHDLDNRSLVQWCKEFYTNWGGRVPLLLLTVLFLYHSVKYWIIFNTCIMTLFVFYTIHICKLFLKKYSLKSLILTYIICFSLFILMPSNTFSEGALWITGSFNYLLPGTMLIVALYPFLALINNKSVKKWEYILSYIGAFLCSYSEQT